MSLNSSCRVVKMLIDKINKLKCYIYWAQAAIKVIVFAKLAIAAMSSAQGATQPQYVQTGIVSRVVDGDTIWVQIGSHAKPLKVRIQSIDAPEICQSGGQQSRAALKSKVLGQTVTVTTSTRDDYGRSVGSLQLQDQDVGQWMVAQGYAWVYSFRYKKGPYARDLAVAQAERRGIFIDATAQEPRVFRKMNGRCELSAYRPTN